MPFLTMSPKISALESFAGDPSFQQQFAAVKYANKARLAKVVRQTLGVAIDPGAMFDVQIKRMHEYKRQLLNILETIALYDAIRADPQKNWTPRVKIFAGKAAANLHGGKIHHQADQ